MKKQLLIAAIAATMTTATMADISLTGYAIVKATTSAGAASAVQNEYGLTIKGTSGDNTAVVSLVNGTVTDTDTVYTEATGDAVSSSATASTSTDLLAIDEAYVSTKLEGLTVIAGVKAGATGTALVSHKNRSAKFIVKASVGGANIALKQGSGNANAKVDVSTTISGVKVKVKDVMNDARYFIVDADVAGVAVHVEGDDTNTAYTLSGDVAGIALTYVAADSIDNDNRDDDGVFGKLTDTGVTGIIASTSTAAGKVTVKRWDADNYGQARTKVQLKRGNATYFVTTSATVDADATIGAKIKFNF
jgi:hypothetical protein